MLKNMEFTDPRKTPFMRMTGRGDLPHLYKPAGLLFVTYRLLDAVLPQEDRVSRIDSADPDPAILLGNYDPPITLGSCILRRAEVAAIVQEQITAGHGREYELLAWCVMPNHVHVVFAPLAEHQAPRILQRWKGASSMKINRLLGRAGTLWERECFDHLVRTAESAERFVRYVHENPVVAGLCSRAEDWPYSSASRKR